MAVKHFLRWVSFKRFRPNLVQLSSSITSSENLFRHALFSNAVSIQLHDYGGASQISYDVCVNVRCYDEFNNFIWILSSAKTQVAPLRTIIVPRFERSDALLVAELVRNISNYCDINNKALPTRVTLMCISWINYLLHLLKTFVAHRVSKIQDTADLLSCGLSPSDLITSQNWFHRPSWFSKPESCWPYQEKLEKLFLLKWCYLKLAPNLVHFWVPFIFNKVATRYCIFFAVYS